MTKNEIYQAVSERLAAIMTTSTTVGEYLRDPNYANARAAVDALERTPHDIAYLRLTLCQVKD